MNDYDKYIQMEMKGLVIYFKDNLIAIDNAVVIMTRLCKTIKTVSER